MQKTVRKWPSTKRWGVEMWVLKEEQVRLKPVGKELHKHNEQCPTEGMSSDWPEQAERTGKWRN